MLSIIILCVLSFVSVPVSSRVPHFVLCHCCTHVWCMSNPWGYDIYKKQWTYKYPTRYSYLCSLLVVILYMFWASLAHHQEFRKLCVQSGVVFNYSWFCLSVCYMLYLCKVLWVMELVCDVCPLGGVCCEFWRLSLFTLCWCRSLVSLCTILYCWL